MTALLYRLRYECADRLRARPWPYLPLVRRFRRDAEGRPKAVTRETELVIEGYPRSGNTFARIAFEMSQPAPIRLAHHLHAPAQVIAAVRYGLPCLVLIRHPEEAVLSQVVREPRLDLARAFRSYLRFHRAIAGVRAGFVLARFETVTQDFPAVIRTVNRRFGTSFESLDATPADLERVRAAVDEHDAKLGKNEAARGRPTPDKENAKAQLLERLHHESAVAGDSARATELYRDWVDHADV